QNEAYAQGQDGWHAEVRRLFCSDRGSRTSIDRSSRTRRCEIVRERLLPACRTHELMARRSTEPGRRSTVLPQEIERPALGFIEHTTDVLPQDADRDELGATKKQDGDHQRRKALHRFPEEQSLGDDPDTVQESGERHGQAEVRGELQGYAREGSDPLESEIPQSPVIPFGFAGEARVPTIWNPVLRISHPGEQALHEPVLLSQLIQCVYRTAAEQPEVARVLRNSDVAQTLHESVEHVRGELLQS